MSDQQLTILDSKSNTKVREGALLTRLVGSSGNEVDVDSVGNIKCSIEELDTSISDNSNTQLKVSPYTLDEFGNYSHLLGDDIFRGALVCITPEHHEIHCGDSYYANYTGVLGNGATLNILIVVPNEGGTGQDQKLYHLVCAIDFLDGAGTVSFLEAPTVTGAGTAIAIRNRNRNSALVDYLTITQGATVSADGTMLDKERVGSGKTIGGQVNRSDEWVLKNNTTYLLRIKNETTSDNYYNVRLNYYVHPGV